jgi:hemerythrin-like domain-containing protein
MTRIIETLLEEHRNIEELLLVLEQELGVFNEGPDYEIIQAIISYFQDYPDCCHHPKEDMVFEKLKARDPVAVERIGDLEAEHQNGSRLLRRVADTIRNFLTGHDVQRQTFDDVMRDFINHERKHMGMEERFLFSAAVNVLRPEDWAGIDARWSDWKDSIFSVAFEEKGQSLRERILQWQRENRDNSKAPGANLLAKNQR